MTAVLNATAYVARYAWFTDNSWTNAQYRWSSMYDGSNRITAVGQAYSRV
jgi:hypothetical protein